MKIQQNAYVRGEINLVLGYDAMQTQVRFFKQDIGLELSARKQAEKLLRALAQAIEGDFDRGSISWNGM